LHTSAAIWTLGENVIAVKYNDLSLACHHNIPLIAGFERLYQIGDSSVIIPNENGFALWNTKKTLKNPEYSLQITDIKIIKGDTDENNDISDLKTDLEILYKNNSLLIGYDVISFFNPPKMLFRTQLDNGEWSNFSTSNTTALSNIPIGNHTFKVETQLENGKKLQDAFSFTIFPPWYLTTWSYGIYVVLLLLILFLTWKLDKLRLKTKERQMKILQAKELKLKEDAFNAENKKKEQEIIRLNNEKLETEIQHKSQELANSAVILGRKNEILIEVKNSLSQFSYNKKQNITLIDINRKIQEISHIIDENIKEDDIFHKFEENFDLVHNNFIKRLTEQYPDLNVSERKLCAYIKMQLSSKEIAPLLNISVRGVETMRLRLRKKLGLHNENLIKYLDNY
jgi:DNA-binding CsgD family transcriptional regulator